MVSQSVFSQLSVTEEAAACLLCGHEPCTAACPHGVLAGRIIRALRFDNAAGAAALLPNPLPCASCENHACVSACVKGRISRPVPVNELMAAAASEKSAPSGTPDLSVEFCGVRCENPFFLSSSVVANDYDMIARAFDMGWAGAAVKTIGTFVPKEVSPRFDVLPKEANPLVGFENIEQISEHTLEENLGYLRRLKRDYPTKVLIASIMGQNEEEWTALARLVTEAGADIIECNFSCPHMAADGLGSDVGQNPELVAAYTRAVRRGTPLPVLAKMTPNLGHMELPALAAMSAGADGLAAINTIKSIVRIDLDSFTPAPAVDGKASVGGYSGKAVKPIALRFIHALKSCEGLKYVPVSGMGGIETWRDGAEFLAMGCDTLQVTTAVMQYGYRIIEDMLDGLRRYLTAHGCARVTDIVGSALPQVVPADALNRDTICYPRFDRARCVGCGRCYVSCTDGGHQAIRWQEEGGRPVLKAARCVGCQLCAAVCPAGAIAAGPRVPKRRAAVS